MSMSKILSGLSDKEKVELAAKLTQAAMSAMNYSQSMATATQQELTELAADRAYMVFGKLMEKISSGEEPQKFPSRSRR